MDTIDRLCDFYLGKLREGQADRAFHSLVEAGPAIIPRLEKAFKNEGDVNVRTEIVRIAWNLRHDDILPLLASALYDDEGNVWKAALDGLVTMGTEKAVFAIERARDRRFNSSKEASDFRRWLDEAIEQIKDAHSSEC